MPADGGGAGGQCHQPSNTFPQSRKDVHHTCKVFRGYTPGYGRLGMHADLDPRNSGSARALLETEWVEDKCVHGDIQKYVSSGKEETVFQFVSRVSIPKDIVIDQGTLFLSRTLKELYK